MEPNIHHDDNARLRQALWLIGGLCVTAILVGWNRKFPPAFLTVPFLDVMRITDTLFMFLFTPLAVILGWLLFNLYGGGRSRLNTILFMLGIYFLGIGFGMHDPFNALHMSKAAEMSPSLRQSVIYFDDRLGHQLFFVGFMLVSLAVIAAETANPWRTPWPWRRFAVPVTAGILAGVIIWHNMINERTSSDIVALLATTLIAALLQALHRVHSVRRLPTLTALYLAYGGGSLATLLGWW